MSGVEGVGGVGGILGAAAQAGAEAKNAKDQAADELSNLQTRIISGEETTDDPLQDGAIAVYGPLLAEEGLFDQVMESYRGINEMLAGRRGQPVLVIHRYNELREGCWGLGAEPTERDYRVKDSLYFGILSDDALRLNTDPKADKPYSATMELPAVRHAVSVPYSGSPLSKPRRLYGGTVRERDMIDGGVVIDGHIDSEKYMQWRLRDKAYPLTEPISESLRAHVSDFGIECPVLEVLVGNEMIFGSTSFDRDNTYYALREMAVDLGVPIPEASGNIGEYHQSLVDETRGRLQGRLDEVRSTQNELLGQANKFNDEIEQLRAEAAILGITLDS